MKSDAMGVHTSQAQEFYDESVALGVPTEFDKQGRAVFRDPSHRKNYCRAMGVHDRNGGYGDP